MCQTRNGVFRPAFTMIECCAALVVFAAIMLLWQPIVHAVTHLQPNDGELIEVLAANRELDELASAGELGVAGDDLVIKSDGVTYVIDDYHSAVNGNVVRMSTTSGGYMPLVAKAKYFRAQKIASGVVQYTIGLVNGEQFTAILTAATGAPRQQAPKKEQLPSADESAVSESKEAVANELP